VSETEERIEGTSALHATVQTQQESRESSYNNHNNHNHELCSVPFTIKPTDQRCLTVKVLSLHTQHKHID